jgi:hypothetical protein
MNSDFVTGHFPDPDKTAIDSSPCRIRKRLPPACGGLVAISSGESALIFVAKGQSRSLCTPASPSPADLRQDNQVVALGPTDGASYDIPNFPVLELARWLAARSKGAYFNLNVRGEYWIDAGDARCSARQPDGHNLQIFFFIKSDMRASAIRAAGSKRRSR